MQKGYLLKHNFRIKINFAIEKLLHFIPKLEYRAKYGVQSFEQFADVFPKELFEKVNTAKKLLTF